MPNDDRSTLAIAAGLQLPGGSLHRLSSGRLPKEPFLDTFHKRSFIDYEWSRVWVYVNSTGFTREGPGLASQEVFVQLVNEKLVFVILSCYTPPVLPQRTLSGSL